ncbi:MAG: hypothetical protein J6T59_03245 [Bacteroidales bacterium]|nr:hypothetical protein [Bacteroidales bacterium]
MIKLNKTLFDFVKKTIFATFLIIFIIGCGPTTPQEEEVVGSEEIEIPAESEGDNTTVVDEPEVGNPVEQDMGTHEEPSVGDTNSPQEANDYMAISTITKNKMTMEETNKLRVWIGDESEASKYRPKEDSEMAHDTIVFPDVKATYARITPNAPDFEVEPKSFIVPISPKGVEKTFILKPLQEGSFQVSAEIELFDNKECIGVGYPVASGEVIVEVGVDNIGHFKKFLRRLGSELGVQFEKFWAALLVVVFGALIFVIRKFIKKKTVYNDNNNQQTPPTDPQGPGSDPQV